LFIPGDELIVRYFHHVIGIFPELGGPADDGDEIASAELICFYHPFNGELHIGIRSHLHELSTAEDGGEGVGEEL